MALPAGWRAQTGGGCDLTVRTLTGRAARHNELRGECCDRRAPAFRWSSFLWPDGVGAESADAAAGVLAHRDRQCRGAGREGGGGAGGGHGWGGVVWGGVGRGAVGAVEGGRGVAGPARLGEQRADDVLLFRVRAGGPPRVRHG